MPMSATWMASYPAPRSRAAIVGDKLASMSSRTGLSRPGERQLALLNSVSGNILAADRAH
jgi:hypothetical protein